MSHAPIQPEPAAIEVVDDDAEPRHARHLAEQGDRLVGRQVVEHQRGMGDVERPVGVGERPAVADVQLEPVGRRPGAGVASTAAARTSARLSMRRRPTSRRPRAAARSSSASGMSAPPVPTSSSVSASRCAASASIAAALRSHPAEPAIDPPQVAQVAHQRGRVVERTVEQLDGVGAAVHARAGYVGPVPCRP